MYTLHIYLKIYTYTYKKNSQAFSRRMKIEEQKNEWKAT